MMVRLLIVMSSAIVVFLMPDSANRVGESGVPPPDVEHDELVPDPVLYRELKEAANRAAGLTYQLPLIGTPGTPPMVISSFEGIRDEVSVPDETSAIGPDRFIAFVNNRFGIFDRDGTLLADGTTAALTGVTQDDFITDPQILWDPSSRRFYYTVYENRNSGGVLDPGIAWGFSTTSSPSSAADFCRYFTRFDYGGTYPSGTFPDFPQLGTIQNFLLIGINRFTFGMSYVGADLAWISKPPPGATCPGAGSFLTGIFRQLRNVDGTLAFTPIPARQVDPAPAGTVVSALWPGDSYLNVYTVQPDPNTGTPLLSAPVRLDVPTYSVPANARQAGTTAGGQPAPLIDTLSGKLTQAYSALDPRLGHTVVWTAHAVFGGAGSEVRWYQIDPAVPRIDQSGVVTDPNAQTFFYFPSLAPDRAVDGTSACFGNNMVLGFNQSSATTNVQIAMVSKSGPASQSPAVLIKTSPGPNVAQYCFDVQDPACQWGDYSGASPDPTPGSTGTGRVWLTNQWNVASTDDMDIDWRTWSWTAAPAQEVPSLTLTMSGADLMISWTPIPPVDRYDIVRGSLKSLRTSGGNFATATEGCVANDQLSNSAMFTGSPAAGDGFWFLVRGVSQCGGSGTYDSGDPAQVGMRDTEIAASANPCP